ncbi:nucleotidyltransferase family protein [Thermodesulfobacteriota bacterium]
MKSMKSIQTLLPEIQRFCERWGVAEFALFGSALRDDMTPESDVDVLVTLAEDARLTLADWVEMQEELSRMFEREVDLVSKTGLRNPFRRHEILRSHKVIYAAPAAHRLVG